MKHTTKEYFSRWNESKSSSTLFMAVRVINTQFFTQMGNASWYYGLQASLTDPLRLNSEFEPHRIPHIYHPVPNLIWA